MYTDDSADGRCRVAGGGWRVVRAVGLLRERSHVRLKLGIRTGSKMKSGLILCAVSTVLYSTALYSGCKGTLSHDEIV